MPCLHRLEKWRRRRKGCWTPVSLTEFLLRKSIFILLLSSSIVTPFHCSRLWNSPGPLPPPFFRGTNFHQSSGLRCWHRKSFCTLETAVHSSTVQRGNSPNLCPANIKYRIGLGRRVDRELSLLPSPLLPHIGQDTVQYC